jgi:16S rRNA (adenine1518-N6/adenine1519-N6)-dimethyltransferase
MIRARKRFGQHFLEPVWVDKVLRAIQAAPHDTFIEIGPGRGALTQPLARTAARVVAFEIDRDLAAALRESTRNVRIVDGDFLDVTPHGITEQLGLTGHEDTSALRVAGNLPYNVASPLLFKMVELYRAGLPVTDATVMVQREVANRLTARPGTHEYGVLGILIRQAADVESLLELPPGAFRPAPRVHSALLRLRFHPDRPVARNRAAFVALTRAIFTRRRKTLSNALAAYVGPANRTAAVATALDAVGIDGRRRPETLALDELVALSDALVLSQRAVL